MSVCVFMYVPGQFFCVCYVCAMYVCAYMLREEQWANHAYVYLHTSLGNGLMYVLGMCVYACFWFYGLCLCVCMDI